MSNITTYICPLCVNNECRVIGRSWRHQKACKTEANETVEVWSSSRFFLFFSWISLAPIWFSLVLTCNFHLPKVTNGALLQKRGGGCSAESFLGLDIFNWEQFLVQFSIQTLLELSHWLFCVSLWRLPIKTLPKLAHWDRVKELGFSLSRVRLSFSKVFPAWVFRYWSCRGWKFTLATDWLLRGREALVGFVDLGLWVGTRGVGI